MLMACGTDVVTQESESVVGSKRVEIAIESVNVEEKNQPVELSEAELKLNLSGFWQDEEGYTKRYKPDGRYTHSHSWGEQPPTPEKYLSINYVDNGSYTVLDYVPETNKYVISFNSDDGSSVQKDVAISEDGKIMRENFTVDGKTRHMEYTKFSDYEEILDVLAEKTGISIPYDAEDEGVPIDYRIVMYQLRNAENFKEYATKVTYEENVGIVYYGNDDLNAAFNDVRIGTDELVKAGWGVFKLRFMQVLTDARAEENVPDNIAIIIAHENPDGKVQRFLEMNGTKLTDYAD